MRNLFLIERQFDYNFDYLLMYFVELDKDSRIEVKT